MTFFYDTNLVKPTFCPDPQDSGELFCCSDEVDISLLSLGFGDNLFPQKYMACVCCALTQTEFRSIALSRLIAVD